jgi:MSHA biogenesis protein MshQ
MAIFVRGAVTGTATGNISRFIPRHFATAVTQGCWAGRVQVALLLLVLCVLLPAHAANLVSQGKTATQSSTSYSGAASRAVDGNTSGVYGNGSVTATGVETQPWWQVDVGQTYGITQVTLWNRTDSCCVSRLSNFYVFVSNSDMSGRTLAQLTADSTVSNQFVSTMPGVSLTLSFGRTGRYVRVQRNGANATGTDEDILSLAEVQVYGTTLLGAYSFEEQQWTGTTGEVADGSGNGLDATAAGLSGTVPTTSRASPAVGTTTGTCRYGVFNRSNKQYIVLPSTFPDLSSIGNFMATAWIRTTDRTQSNQRILIQDESGYNTNSTGWLFSLGDYGAGTVSFFTRATGSPGSDKAVSAAVISNNTWYFVAFGVDTTAKKKYVYVYDASGTLLSQVTTTYTGSIGPVPQPLSIGGETNSAGGNENTSNYGFAGNIDEVRVYSAVLTTTELSAVQALSSACAGVDHYELTLPSSSLACLTSAVSVQACYDSSSPCTNPSTALSGQTATLAASAGATLASTTLTFDASGRASTTLSDPTASNGMSVAVTLSGESWAATNARKCCPDGVSCSAANSCSTTFNTAGFIVAAAAGGASTTLPTQTAGTASSGYYLRAVKTNTSTQACQAAITGSTTVNWAYQCNNPTTCSTGNRMSLTGNSATTIAANPASGVSSYLSVPMTFDANGNAPFSFTYSDVGQVTLYATKAASGSLLTSLSGNSNAFVVKPAGFVLSGIKCTSYAAGACATSAIASPGNNPAAASAAGTAFIAAGDAFSATVTALDSSASAVPNFGKETSPEGVTLTPNLVLPVGGNAGTIGNAAAFGSFTGGVATGTTFSFSEVGIITLTPSLASGSYLGTGSAVTGTTTGNVGRFIPDHFTTAVTPGCSASFTYSGQPMTATVTAKNAAGTTVQNYASSTGFSRAVTLSDGASLGTGSLTGNSVASTAFGAGVASATPTYTFTSKLTSPGTLILRAADTDGVGSSGWPEGSSLLRSGRLRLSNGYGRETASLQLALQAEYWSGNSWLLNSSDSCTTVPAAAVAFSNKRSNVGAATSAWSTTASSTSLAAGTGLLTLSAPSPTATGAIDIALNLGSTAADQSCLSTHPASTGAGLAWLRSQNGNCVATYDRDPSGRASFGIYTPESKKTIHIRELF